ncbi:hypothetical protein CPHO_05925 [Corynebacterium phocae]|uniref:Cardiolipin synthase N-terminal domain-containing protein n=1 Tax=Corynebacterium phocae TaxID=161895 RepID=A0A1L7D6F3_9CORY|nr:hypothetical protein [Corynebacterium phocae]APT93700.1 hypothetical protein CPHO_05925 [Corynebacterium phocae]KAA8725107.1 hypothetical protein F4V58_05465 [Corynebacterium phocae]
MTLQAKWEKLSPKGKTAVIGAAAADISLTAAAWHFLYHLPRRKIRGSKKLWFLVSLVDVVGPLVFLSFGIKR